MEEKTLLKSTRYNIKRGLLIFMLIVVGIFIVSSCAVFFDTYDPEHYADSFYLQSVYDSAIAWAWAWSSWTIISFLYIVVGLALICVLIYAWLHSYEMTITDKRVYGKAAFGTRVDLPLDSVSATGMCMLKGVSVSTASGRIAFLFIKNRDEIHKCIGDLLVERQSKAAPVTTIKQESPQSNADELKKYKELLDSGVITQEEFDAKKKQLLGL